MHRTLKVDLEHREWQGKLQESVKFVNASDFPDCKHVFKEKKRETAAAKPQESFTSSIPAQPEGLSLGGDLGDFEDIISDGEVPF